MDEISEHSVTQLSKVAKDKMARLAAQVPNGGQAVALQLMLVEFEVLKAMLFEPEGPLPNLALEHAHMSLTRFIEWADDMQRTIVRANLLRGSNGSPG